MPKIEQSSEAVPIAPESKNSRKVFFSYLLNETSFQVGYLGADKSTIEGILHLRYTDDKPIFAKKIKITFVGKEYVFFKGTLEEGQNIADDESGFYDVDEQVSTTTISTHTAKRKFFDSNLTVWRSQSKGHYEGVKSLDLPFKFNLPNNLPPSVLMDKGCGRIYYMLKAVISRRSINPNSRNQKKIVKIVVPVVRHTIITPKPEPFRWLVKNDGPSKPHVVGYDVSMTRSIFGPGESIVIPIKLFFHEPHVYLKKIFVGLKEYHELRTDRYETSTKRYIFEETINADEIQTPSSPDNECFVQVKFDMPSEGKLVYDVDSTYLAVSHKLKFKVILGRAPDIHFSKGVKVEKIVTEEEVFPPQPTAISMPQENIVIHEPIVSKPKRESLRRLTPFFPLFDKIQKNDTTKKISVQLQQLDKNIQLQLRITDSKDPSMVYNSRSLVVPVIKHQLQSPTRPINQAY